MGPPREHGGMRRDSFQRRSALDASMGPPREHGGMLPADRWDQCGAYASMGPPREHGGMSLVARRLRHDELSLQWGRRVNTAECQSALVADVPQGQLQWGRRVNTAEWHDRA